MSVEVILLRTLSLKSYAIFIRGGGGIIGFAISQKLLLYV